MEVVRVDKKTLQFQVPSSSSAMASDTLLLTNTTPDASLLAFKVKTTNQIRYVVRPNMGIIPPRATQALFIMLRPGETPTIGLSQDKFLVCVTSVPSTTGVEELSSDFWGRQKASINNVKLGVEFSSAPIEAISKSPIPETPIPDSAHLRGLLEAENLEITYLRTEPAKEKAETVCTLKQAPVAPLLAYDISLCSSSGMSEGNEQKNVLHQPPTDALDSTPLFAYDMPSDSLGGLSGENDETPLFAYDLPSDCFGGVSVEKRTE